MCIFLSMEYFCASFDRISDLIFKFKEFLFGRLFLREILVSQQNWVAKYGVLSCLLLSQVQRLSHAQCPPPVASFFQLMNLHWCIRIIQSPPLMQGFISLFYTFCEFDEWTITCIYLNNFIYNSSIDLKSSKLHVVTPAILPGLYIYP